MAFQKKRLMVIAYANGFTQWCYDVKDDSELILEQGYFNDVKTLMNTGDVIICHGENTFFASVNIDKDGVKIKKM